MTEELKKLKENLECGKTVNIIDGNKLLRELKQLERQEWFIANESLGVSGTYCPTCKRPY